MEGEIYKTFDKRSVGFINKKSYEHHCLLFPFLQHRKTTVNAYTFDITLNFDSIILTIYSKDVKTFSI